jgi:hypothetical protein
MRVQIERPGGQIAMVDLVPKARDEAGTPYTTWPHGGSGGWTLSRVDWRLAFRFGPRIPLDASEIRIEIADVGLLRQDPASGELAEPETTNGPWSFAIRLV